MSDETSRHDRYRASGSPSTAAGQNGDRALMRAGELARRTGVSTETVRYYERLELLRDSSRSAGGQRLFAPSSVRTVETVKRLLAIGFGLAQIVELFTLVDDRQPGGDPEARTRCVQEIEDRLRDLRAVRAALRDQARFYLMGLPSGRTSESGRGPRTPRQE